MRVLRTSKQQKCGEREDQSLSNGYDKASEDYWPYEQPSSQRAVLLLDEHV
jgi:hypothetical protein